MTLERIRIILVEPAGSLNVGSVARVMKNMGLQQLWLVNPQCDYLGKEARQMAVHGADVLESAREVSTLPDALSGCQRAIATTARVRDLPIQLEPPRLVLPWLLDDSVNSALIFGPENRGLNNIELNYAQKFLAIPAHPEYPVLNLAQAVTICCYELYQIFLYGREWGVESGEWGVGEMGRDKNSPSPRVPASPHPIKAGSEAENSTSTSTSIPLVTLDVLEAYFEHLEAVLRKIGYLYPHTAVARMEKLRRLLHRASPTAKEVTMLRGIIRQTEWALQFLPRRINDRGGKL